MDTERKGSVLMKVSALILRKFTEAFLFLPLIMLQHWSKTKRDFDKGRARGFLYKLVIHTARYVFEPTKQEYFNPTMAPFRSAYRRLKKFFSFKFTIRSFKIGRFRKHRPGDHEEIVERTAGTGFVTSPAQPEAVQATSLLFALPPEVRMTIYKYLLISPRPLCYLENREIDGPILFSVPFGLKPDIDATLLRTCQAIYREALPILYQSNTFSFDDPSDIIHFRDANLPFLGRSIPALDGLSNPYGMPFDRGIIWRHWSDNLFNVDDREDQVGFPSLERLALNFTPWHLAPSDGIIVEPFIYKFSEFGRLHELTVIGLAQEPTLARLRGGLVKPGGKFNAVPLLEEVYPPEGAEARKEYFRLVSLTRGFAS
ncbi:hypothetical protein MMC07_004264 [Pseudocyphellaria aurata]|nr:hypothetical protein [Pseudocyphellaria aurata]